MWWLLALGALAAVASARKSRGRVAARSVDVRLSDAMADSIRWAARQPTNNLMIDQMRSNALAELATATPARVRLLWWSIAALGGFQLSDDPAKAGWLRSVFVDAVARARESGELDRRFQAMMAPWRKWVVDRSHAASFDFDPLWMSVGDDGRTTVNCGAAYVRYREGQFAVNPSLTLLRALWFRASLPNEGGYTIDWNAPTAADACRYYVTPAHVDTF